MMARTDGEVLGRHDIARDPQRNGYRCIVCGKHWDLAQIENGGSEGANIRTEECPGVEKSEHMFTHHRDDPIVKAAVMGQISSNDFKPEKEAERQTMVEADESVNPPFVNLFDLSSGVEGDKTVLTFNPGGLSYVLKPGETLDDVMARVRAENAQYEDDDVRHALQVLRDNDLVVAVKALADYFKAMDDWKIKHGYGTYAEYTEYYERSGPNAGKPYHIEQHAGIPVRLLRALEKALGR